MHAPDPAYREAVRRIFTDAAFLADVGIELLDCGPGWCESTLAVAPRHLQQTGVVHAGVQSTLADHTAGGAAMSLVEPDRLILTTEFKIHLLRPGHAESLFCRADVLKPGRLFHVVEAQVFARHRANGGKDVLISKFTGTMAVVPRNRT